MDRMRHVSVRQQHNPGTPGAPASPLMSPMHHHARSGSIGNVKKANTRAAAQRLAQVMAHQPEDDDEGDDDLSYEYTPASVTGSIGLAAGRGMHPRSPMVIKPELERTNFSTVCLFFLRSFLYMSR